MSTRVRRPPANELEPIKWIMDGSRTLEEAASRVREYADYIDEKRKRGWELSQPVEDGYGWLERRM